MKPLEERFWSKVDMSGDCWLWTGAQMGPGYGHLRVGRRSEGTITAHRFAWEQANGAVPEGMELDHLCRVRHCVNPAHIEAVPHRTNVLRGNAPTAILYREGRCANGHAVSPENTYFRKGTRKVVSCRAYLRERRHETK